MTDLQWARISNDAFNVALFAYIAAMVGYFAHLAFKRDAIWQVSRAVAVVGVAANLVSIVARGLAADRVPWGNMYEYSSMLALLVVVGALVVVEGVYKVRSLTGFALMFSVLTMAVAVSFLYVGPGPLVPALNSYWIKIHVQAAIWGSSLFALGGIATIAYLVVDRVERRKVERARLAHAAADHGRLDRPRRPDAPHGRRARRPRARLRRGRGGARRAAAGSCRRPPGSTGSPTASSRSPSRSGRSR